MSEQPCDHRSARRTGRQAAAIATMALAWGSTGTAALLPQAVRANEAAAECVGPPSNTRVHVTIEKIRSGDGLIAITLYADDMSRFLVKRGALFVRRVPTQAPETQFCLFVPSPGTYGIAIYHDANANYHIDRAGFWGLPTEGFGFSNNASTLLGLPNFRSVRIKLHNDMHTRIRLRYLRGDEAQKHRHTP